MISPETFVTEWAALEERFRVETSTAMMERYREYLNPRMSDEEFRAAARQVFATNRFFPRPADFLLVESVEQWRLLQARVDAFNPPHGGDDWRPGLSARAVQAVRDLGGILAVKEAINRDGPRFRDRWEQAYESVLVADAGVALGAGDDQPRLPAGASP